MEREYEGRHRTKNSEELAFSEVLTQTLCDLGLTKQELAGRTGCSYSMIKQYCSGDATPPPEKQERIRSVLAEETEVRQGDVLLYTRMPTKRFGDVVYHALEDLSQEFSAGSIARDLGISDAEFSRIKNGTKPLNAKAQYRILQKLLQCCMVDEYASQPLAVYEDTANRLIRAISGEENHFFPCRIESGIPLDLLELEAMPPLLGYLMTERGIALPEPDLRDPIEVFREMLPPEQSRILKYPAAFLDRYGIAEEVTDLYQEYCGEELFPFGLMRKCVYGFRLLNEEHREMVCETLENSLPPLRYRMYGDGWHWQKLAQLRAMMDDEISSGFTMELPGPTEAEQQRIYNTFERTFKDLLDDSAADEIRFKIRMSQDDWYFWLLMVNVRIEEIFDEIEEMQQQERDEKEYGEDWWFPPQPDYYFHLKTIERDILYLLELEQKHPDGA